MAQLLKIKVQVSSIWSSIWAKGCMLHDCVCSGGYHMENGGMPLHGAVGINCKKGATIENQG